MTRNMLGFMLSNRPDMAIGSLRHYEAFDKVYIYHHESQKLDFEAAYQESDKVLPPIEFIYHNIDRHKDNGPPLGAIRYHLMREAQRVMGRRDTAIMVDDDLKSPRYVEPSWFKRSNGPIKWVLKKEYDRYPVASPQIFRRELEKVAFAARIGGFQFFDGVHNARPKNGYNPTRPFRAAWQCNMMWGFFKNSFNPFDPTISEAEDYAAECKLIDQFKTLTILCHYGLVPEFEIIRKKYSLDSPRNNTIRNLSISHPWLYLATNFAANQNKDEKDNKDFAAPRVDRIYLNKLKATVSVEYR